MICKIYRNILSCVDLWQKHLEKKIHLWETPLITKIFFVYVFSLTVTSGDQQMSQFLIHVPLISYNGSSFKSKCYCGID